MSRQRRTPNAGSPVWPADGSVSKAGVSFQPRSSSASVGGAPTSLPCVSLTALRSGRREASPISPVITRDQGDANRETAAGKPDLQRREKHHRIGADGR